MRGTHLLYQTKDTVKNEQRMTSVLITQHFYKASEIEVYVIMLEGKNPLKIKTYRLSVAVQTRDTGVITESWSTYWSMIDMANGICRAFQSLFLLVALLSVFSGMCFDTLVLECERPFYCKVKAASQTAHCDGVNGGWQGCLAWFWEYSRFASIRLLQKILFFVIREFLSPAISEDLEVKR